MAAYTNLVRKGGGGNQNFSQKLLTLNRSPLAGNDSSNCYIFMLVTVTHNMAVTHIIRWKK